MLPEAIKKTKRFVPKNSFSGIIFRFQKRYSYYLIWFVRCRPRPAALVGEPEVKDKNGVDATKILYRGKNPLTKSGRHPGVAAIALKRNTRGFLPRAFHRRVYEYQLFLVS